MINISKRFSGSLIKRLFSSKKKSVQSKVDSRKASAAATQPPKEQQRVNPKVPQAVTQTKAEVMQSPPEPKEVVNTVLVELSNRLKYKPGETTLYDKVTCQFGILSLYNTTAYFAYYPLFQEIKVPAILTYMSFVGMILYQIHREKYPQAFHDYIRRIEIFPERRSLRIDYDLVYEKSVELSFDQLYKRVQLMETSRGETVLRVKIANPDRHGEVLDLLMPLTVEMQAYITQGRVDLVQAIGKGELSALAKVDFVVTERPEKPTLLDEIVDESSESTEEEEEIAEKR